MPIARGERHRRWKPRSIRGRITLTALAVSAIAMLVALTAASLAIRSGIEETISAETAQSARKTANDLAAAKTAGPLPVHPGRMALVQVVGRRGEVVDATAQLRGRPPLTTERPAPGEGRVDTIACPPIRSTCLYVVGITAPRTPYGPVTVYSAMPLPPVLGGVILEAGLAVLGLALLAFIGWGTWRMVGHALAPVEAIRRDISGRTGTDLDRPVPVPPTGDEVQLLAETVNDLRERLYHATERQRRFVAEASHDLRNPITGLQTRLEGALDDPDDDSAHTMRSALRDARRLQDIVSDLLEIARLDAGTVMPTEEVELASLVRAELARRDPPHITISTRLAPDVVVRCSRTRLTRVLNNLLDNAERHAADHVRIAVTADPPHALLEVADNGPGIPPESREQVFERFARLADSRRLDPGGTGLGLPIAREIAQAHGGRLDVADVPAGACLVLSLPLVDRTARPPAEAGAAGENR